MKRDPKLRMAITPFLPEFFINVEFCHVAKEYTFDVKKYFAVGKHPCGQRGAYVAKEAEINQDLTKRYEVIFLRSAIGW